MEPNNPLLDDYILEQAHRDTPRVCFIPTASGDAEGYIGRFYQSFRPRPCVATHLSLFKPTGSDPCRLIQEQDVLYVGGGNTRNLLVLWREWGLDAAVRQAWERGVVLAGLSAGSLCWYEEGLSDSLGAGFSRIEGLGLLPGSHCPHFGNEEGRRPAYVAMIGDGSMRPGVAADDSVALHYIDTHLAHALSSRPQAGAYRVSRSGDGVAVVRVDPMYLGDSVAAEGEGAGH